NAPEALDASLFHRWRAHHPWSTFLRGNHTLTLNANAWETPKLRRYSTTCESGQYSVQWAIPYSLIAIHYQLLKPPNWRSAWNSEVIFCDANQRSSCQSNLLLHIPE